MSGKGFLSLCRRLVSQEIETTPKVKNHIENGSVSWTGFDVLLFIALWMAAQFIIGVVIVVVNPNAQPHVQMAADEDGVGPRHPVEQLIQKSTKAPIVLLVAFLSGVVAAPLIEEFLFRLLLQGWLESKLLQFQVPCASGVAIVAVSFCFAVIHAGNPGDSNVQALFYVLLAFVILHLSIFVFGIIYLVRRRNIKLADLLLGTERSFRPEFFPKFFINAGYCLLVILFCLGLTAVLDWNYPNTNTNPIPIFFFSLLLGTVYSRTRILSYCILLHACLNIISLIHVLLVP
jgi:membrane protease YdiL (CAAX protease family)